MLPIRFKTRLLSPMGSTWTYLPIPRSIGRKLNLRVRSKLGGTVNGVRIEGVAMRDSQGGFALTIPAATQAAAAARPGAEVDVVLGPDAGVLSVLAPADVTSAIRSSPAASECWKHLPTRSRREALAWIQAAASPEGRDGRVREVVYRLAFGITLPTAGEGGSDFSRL